MLTYQFGSIVISYISLPCILFSGKRIITPDDISFRIIIHIILFPGIIIDLIISSTAGGVYNAKVGFKTHRFIEFIQQSFKIFQSSAGR